MPVEYIDALGDAVKDAMDKHTPPLSTRDVQRLSRGRISPTSVLWMRDGRRPSNPELLVYFAVAVGQNPNRFLKLAGTPLRDPRYDDCNPPKGAVGLSEALAAAR